MQVPIPGVQNEPVHDNRYKKYPPKQVKWALLHALADTPIHQTHTSTYQDLPRHSNEPSPSPLIVSPYPGSHLERKENISVDKQTNLTSKINLLWRVRSGVNDKSHFSNLRQVIFLSASFRGPATTLRLGMLLMINRVNLSRENNTLHMAPSPRAKLRTLSQSEIAKKNRGIYSLSFYSALK